jgi:SAM-dependent methyltransferase
MRVRPARDMTAVVPVAYDRFAPHFDAWQRAFGGAYDDLILPCLLTALRGHPWPIRRVVDLGIGTGDLVVALAREGYAVIGVDRSPAMLDVAGSKIAASGLVVPPLLLQQDLRSLQLGAPVDAAICVYTVMNQLTGDGDLGRAMTAVHDALVPGGIFLFELNLPEAYERYWSGTESTALPDAVVVREHRRAGGIVEALVRIDHADGTTVHDRIAQRPYVDAEIESALAAAGLDLVSVDRFNPFTPGDMPVKALWSAQRARA